MIMLNELEMAEWAKVRRRGMLFYVFVRGAIAWGCWMIACFYFFSMLENARSIMIALVVFPVAGCFCFTTIGSAWRMLTGNGKWPMQIDPQTSSFFNNVSPGSN
jgi:hypothetical protein